MEYGEKHRRSKSELKKFFTNLPRRGITDDMMAILIDLCYNVWPSLRTSGFFWPGAPDAIMSWDNNTRALMLEPRLADPGAESPELYEPFFRFYSWAEKPVFQRRFIWDETSEIPNRDQVQIPDEEGLFAFYYDADQETGLQVLTYVKNPDREDVAFIYLLKVIVAWVYFIPGTGAIYYGDSRHGSEFNPAIHWMEHDTLNSRRELGIAIVNAVYNGDGSEKQHYQFGISSGSLWHGDIREEFGAVGVAESLPVWYFDGSGRPRYLVQAGKKFINNGLVAYNTGGAVVAAGDGNLVLYHLFATNCLFQPHISAMGRKQYESLADAYMAIEQEMRQLRHDLPHSNLMHVGTVIIQTSSDFLNAAKARLMLFPPVDSAYVYIAWAGDDQGSDFTLTFDPELDYIAIITTDYKIEFPAALHFEGYWKKYKGEDGVGGGGLSEISFEFCVETGVIQTFNIDIYSPGYTISKAILESDGSLEGVAIEIDGAPVSGLDDMDVSSVDVFFATAGNVAGEGKRVTIVTSGLDTGTPTVLRGKIVLA